jgi:hypothetical protein
MKKRFVLGLTLALGSLFITSTAYTWNFATHAYIAAKIGKLLPLYNFNEMYGLMAPDIFNFDFSLMEEHTLRGYTHGIPPDGAMYPPYSPANYNFMNVWYSANWGLKKSAAFGFVAHNDAWGADFVAHWRAVPTADPTPIPFPIYAPPDCIPQPPGYIIYLAAALDAGLALEGVWTTMGLETDYPTRLMFCHNIIEYAGDLVLKRVDPLIGQKIILACALRTPEFAKLLKDGFDHLYDPLVTAGEPAYRKMLMQYGLILLMPEQTAINMLAAQLAGLAIDYLAFVWGITPEELEASMPGIREQLTLFGQGALAAGIQVCEAPPFGLPSYMQEVNSVAVPWVKAQLRAHGVIY